MDETGQLKAYNNIYLEIIMRYKDHIEEREGLYLTDLPKLVTPNDESVMLLAKEIEGNFPVYSYEDNFADAAKLAYGYVKDRILPISLPIQFWLKPHQTIKYGAGDIFDKAVLLCSMLIAMGNVSSRIIVAVKNTDRHFIVYSEFGNRIIGINIENGVKEYANIESLLGDIGIDSRREDDDTTAYEFNDKIYRDIV